MKPFPKDLQSYHPESHRVRLIETFVAFKAEFEQRLRSTKPVKDRRKGFGTVYSPRQIRGVSVSLTGWNWNHPRPKNYRTDLGAEHFADDPMGARPTDSLGTRMHMATAFADTANVFFAKISDGDFVARPLEVVSTARGGTPGIHPGKDCDLLVIDLMLELSGPKVVDRLVRDHFEDRYADKLATGLDGLQPDIWHEITRLNAARAMLEPSSRPVHFPDRSSLKRRLTALEDEYYRTADS